MMFRLPYQRSIQQLIPEMLRQPLLIDYADAIFGFVRKKNDFLAGELPPQGNKARAYAGRMFVSDAMLVEGQTDIWLSNAPITPNILATPKPTAFQHYLTQQDPNDRNQLDHYDSPSPHETTIRGHKRYWHQALSPETGLTLDQIRKLIEDERARRGMLEATSTQHTRLKPIKPGVRFTFRIYFENLSACELGSLCWTLHPLGDPSKEYYHHVGMGKPLGMGAVKLEAILHLTDRQARYVSLFDGDNWQTGTTVPGELLSERAVLEQRTSEFEQRILEALGLSAVCQHLFQVKRVGMLLKMMEWPGYPAIPNGDRFLEDQNRPNTRYMRIQPNEYRDRFVLPDPCSFGELTGDHEPNAVPGRSRSSSVEVVGGNQGRILQRTASVSPDSVRQTIQSLRGPGEISRMPDIVRMNASIPDVQDRHELAETVRQWLVRYKRWKKEPHASKEWHKLLEQWLDLGT